MREAMKITGITVLKFLGMSSFKMSKPGHLNVFKGGNGVGKSSIVKALREAFKSSGKDPYLIQAGADKATIAIQLNDYIEVQRKITPTDNRLTVVEGDRPVDRPVEYLKALLGSGNLEFNPMEFFLADARERREMILKSTEFTLDPAQLVDVIRNMEGDHFLIDIDRFDFSQHGLQLLADIKKDLYDRRAEKARDVLRIKKSIEQDEKDIPDTFDKKRFEGFDINSALKELSGLKDKLAERNAKAAKVDSLRDRLNQIKNEIAEKKERIEDIKKQIARLETEITQLSEKKDSVVAEGRALKEEFEADKTNYEDLINSVQALINDYDKSQKLVLKLESIEEKKAGLKNEDDEHTALDKLHGLMVNDIPREILDTVHLPIEGLTITEDDVFVKGVELSKMSNSEQMRFAVEMARSLAGSLKVICLDGAEALDDDSFGNLVQECKDDGYQYVLTRVTSGPLQVEVDGEIKKLDEASEEEDQKKPGQRKPRKKLVRQRT
jgi:exonuclease SbcC